jgi:HAD superfamily hydrolase (TIGR01484 family)
MRYLALASDYDGTLAHDGVAAPETIETLERVARTGRKLILVTGRELPDLETVFPQMKVFDRIVAENGALLYNPATREKRILAQGPPEEFIDSLRERGVKNISVGDVIVATWHPHEQQVIQAIHDSGLELQVIFNKDAVMILPSGVNKMTGLTAALEELQLSHHNVVGIGDAENDHAFLKCCECGVAVANSIPSLKTRADFVTDGRDGAGVVELANKLIETDLAGLAPRLGRHYIAMGKAGGREVTIAPYGRTILVAGQSGSGKSTLVTGLVQRAIRMEYQICLIDPEGDFSDAAGFVTTGDTRREASLDHLKKMLDDPTEQANVDLEGVEIKDRAAFFARVLAVVQERRVCTGRPHWLIIDEAHHVLPRDWAANQSEAPHERANIMMITVHPGQLAPAVLRSVNTLVIAGREPREILRQFAEAAGLTAPAIPAEDLEPGKAVVWFLDSNEIIPNLAVEAPRGERIRHKKKYAEGKLGEDRVFHFRGSRNMLDLRVENLMGFVQIASGIDDETWLFHLKNGEYSKWFREAVKDEPLSEEINRIANDDLLSAAESRKRVIHAIEEKYTAPA